MGERKKGIWIGAGAAFAGCLLGVIFTDARMGKGIPVPQAQPCECTVSEADRARLQDAETIKCNPDGTCEIK